LLAWCSFFVPSFSGDVGYGGVADWVADGAGGAVVGVVLRLGFPVVLAGVPG
jgi:hypothetical protein